MKPSIFFLALAMMSLSETLSAQASNPQDIYWVLETNIHHRNISSLKFYSGNEFLDSIQIEGRIIDLNKRKHKRWLEHQLKRYTIRKTSTVSKSKTKTSI